MHLTPVKYALLWFRQFNGAPLGGIFDRPQLNGLRVTDVNLTGSRERDLRHKDGGQVRHNDGIQVRFASTGGACVKGVFMETRSHAAMMLFCSTCCIVFCFEV